ncbi:LPD5 domain-containing protein [Aeromonas media]|uniref:LPD38 domain-containing protein n=1 Tax=Aeromonas media TaxID=651 RepID=UPI001F437767|nr:LPD38 domain-containing protein [Aeromonas media]MCE9926593.1 LPD5 domain-containing protein [Aeromonas media]
MDKPGLRDALPQPRQSDTRNDPFWSTLDSSLSAAAAAPLQPAEPVAKRDLDVGLGDVARGVGAGALDLVGGIGELARQASNFGKENAGKQGGDYLDQSRANLAGKLSPVLDFVAGAGDLAKSGAESLSEGMSPDAKEAMSRRLVDETPEGRLTLGDGAGDIDVWAMKMAQGVGSLLPTLAAGGVTGLAAKASIGRAVTASMVKRGATQEIAEAVAAKAVSKIATGAAVTTGATGSVGSAGVNTRDTVLGMSFDELAASDTFRQAFTRIDQDQQTELLSDEEKLALAREETANLASRATMSDAKTWGAAAMGSMMGDAMLFKMLAGKAAAGGVLKGAAKGAMGEGVGETLEEGVQQYAVNEALNEVAAADIDPMKGVVSSALEGGLIGMGTGGAVGAVGGMRGGKHVNQQEETAADPVIDPTTPVMEAVGDPSVDPVPTSGPAQMTEQESELAADVDGLEMPLQGGGEQNPLGPSPSQFDELRDVPAYLRHDDTTERFKGMAQDSEVQRALAGEFGLSVQELVTTQIQGGEQGKSLYERAQGGELGADPFAGNKSALQVATEGQRPALPLKDVIFAGDANAKHKGEGVSAPGDHDDRQSGPGPQFRGSERTRWQSGQEGDLLPPEVVTEQASMALPGATIEGEGREVGTELPHLDVIYGGDQRQPDATQIKEDVPAGAETDSIFGPLRTLRITRKGKPFASEKEAAMASRKGKETPVPLNGGGFGVAEIAEVEQVRAEQPTPSQPQQLAPAVDTGYRDVIPSSEQSEVTHGQPTPIPAISSERPGDQPGAGDPVATGVGSTPAELAERAGPGDPADGASLAPVPVTQPGEENALTAPAPAGVAVSEGGQPEQARATAGPAAAPTPWSGMIDSPDGTITLKGEVPIIKQWAKDNGVKAIPGKGGLVVSTTSVAKVRQLTTPATSEPVRQIEAARAEVAPEPTEAQREAGNYKKGHIKLQGLDIALENPKGSTRSGTDQDGKSWHSTMAHDYGYIKRTLGADGDHVDVFIGDQPDSEMVYVVDQVDPGTGKFDEHKVMMGFANEQAARAGYLANYEQGWEGLGAIKSMPVDTFKRWVKEGDTTKPVKGLRGTGSGKADVNAMVSAAKAERKAERAKAVDDAGTGHPDLDEVIATFSKEPIRNDRNASLPAQKKVYDTIKEARGLHDAYRFSTLLDSNWQNDRDEAIKLAKDVYSEIGAKASSKLSAAKPVPAAGSKETITDFGEKIGGSRKDVWTAYRDSVQGETAEEIRALPLAKAWPAPDYQKLIDEGSDLAGVGLMRAARDAIPAKPRTGYKVSSWANAVKQMRDLALGILDGSIDVEAAGRVMATTSLRSAHAILHKAELYQTVGHQRSLADLELSSGSYSLYNGVKYDPPKSIWTISRASKSSAFGNWPRTIAHGETKEQVLAAFKARYDQLTDTNSKPKAVSFDIYSRKNGSGWVVGKKVGRNYLDLSQPFEQVAEARAYRDAHQDELIAQLKRRKDIPDERRDLNQPRVGEDMRGGADVTPELFANAFGFRGVEFGNWVEQGRRQRDLNDAFDALMDLAAVLGISPKAISLNGELGLAFGARGSGGVKPAAAHYEPGKVVINLTKMNGAGSLGHEWWHALDNYFSRLRGKAGDNMTEALDVDMAARGSDFIHKGEVRKEIVVAFGAVMRAIKQTALRARSSKLDSKRTKQYWTTNTEMSARAFESYLISKLQDQGASNDYLANIVDEATWEASAKLGWELDNSYPYPTAGEVPGIRAGFDNFFSTLETKQEGDRVILFSKQAMAQGDKPAKHLTRAEAELVTQMWFKRYRGANGIKVQIHATQGELEGALGLDAKEGLIRRAAFDDDAGTLHVAADTISDPKRMREILRHEVLAHYGLANVLGDGEYTKLMSRLIQSQKDPSMKPVWDWVNTHYADEDIGTQAEEVVAHLAELEQGAWGRGWDQVVAWVTRALRAVGFVPDGITVAETRSLIEGLGKKLQRTGPEDNGPDGGKKFSQEDAQALIKKGGVKMSQTATAADKAMGKLNLGAKPDIIDKSKANLDKLRALDRGVVESWVDRVIKKANTEVLDALAPIKYAEEAAGITDAADSGYVAARMATGAASTMQATMLYGLPEWKDGVIQRKAGTGEKDALLGIFSDLGSDLHNWLGWMAGHRAEILLAQGRENLLDANDIAALKAQGKGKEAKFMEAKARWNRLNAATLDLAQEAGLFTADARAEFESEWYIPFFRESDDGDVIAPFKPRGIANQNAGIKKLKGGEANTNDLLENIFTSTSKLIDASMKNMAAQKTVWNLADTGIIEVVAKPNMMDWRALNNGKDLITVKLEGEDYMIRVEDPDLYRAMTFFDRKPFGAMVNVAAKAKRLLTAGVTASPEFMLRNFLRDSLSSWAISKDGFKPMIDSIKGVKKTLAMDGSTIDVMFSGASFLGGYVNGNDPGAMADTVRKSLRRKGMTPEQIARYEKSIIRNAAHAKGVVADAWEKYSRVGEAVENGNREAVYDAAIKAGKSHAQAAFESKDLMDFSMLGASRTMQVMTQVLPFFNARVQGLGKLTRELRDNPRAIAKRAGMITAASLALLAHNWDDERYEGLPDWDKDANWHFWLGEHHWRIPKPFEIGVLFGTIPERMVRALGDKDTGAQFGKAVARAIGDTFALNPTPQLVKPMVEAAFNYDSFRGGPIDGPQDLNVQAEARYNEQTSLLMRELGELTGFSPKQLEHLVIGYTGTMGSYVMAAADGLIRAARPGESASWRADEIPLVKAVYRGTGPAKSTQHMEEFYRMLNEVNQLKRTVDQYRSEGLTDKASELLEEQGGILKSRRSLSRTQQQVRVVRNKIELIQRDRTLAAEEKRRRIDEMLARRNDLVYQAVNKNKANWE